MKFNVGVNYTGTLVQPKGYKFETTQVVIYIEGL